jgi:hypothetical protein
VSKKEQDPHEKSAKIEIKLTTDSYTSTTEGRISPDQWGRISAIIHEPAIEAEGEVKSET